MNDSSQKTPLVLLSGLLCDRFVWEAVADNLAGIADVTTFSFAGFNDISAMANYVLSKAPKKFSLAGHSMGGRVALEVYRKAPGRVTRLALLNTGVHSLKDSEIPSRKRLLDLADKDGMEAIADTWLPPMMSSSALKNSNLMMKLRAMVLRHSTDDFHGEIESLLNRPNAEEVLPLISVPTLLLSGSEDAWSPVSQHREIQKKISKSQLIALDDVGHMSTVEAPEKISRALESWLPLGRGSMNMSYAQIHQNWDKGPKYITEGYSIEITAKDVARLREVAEKLPAQTPVAVTFLPGETLDARVAAACAIRKLGLEPMPHFSARRIQAEDDLKIMLERMVGEAGVRRCFVIAGDPAQAEGPYSDSSSLIETGLFEALGIQAIGIAGHPEGHPNMTSEGCLEVLEKKCAMIHDRGMKPLIVTQFGFDPNAFLSWLKVLRARGIDVPVRIGVPGPTSIPSLMKFAARCGVLASTSVLTKYGVSITKLMGNAGPDKMVDAFAKRFNNEHGRVRLHFYPFGGLSKTVDWVDGYTNKNM